jgi:exosortase F-associated protein
VALLRHNAPRWFLGAAALVIIVATYLFQQFDFSSLAGIDSHFVKFVVNKSTRFILNDLACLLLIVAIFNKSDYVRISAWVFLVELVILLPLYFVLKLSLEGDSEISSPLLSQFHRMIVNPLLMIVLMLGFVYQDYFYNKKTP